MIWNTDTSKFRKTSITRLTAVLITGIMAILSTSGSFAETTIADFRQAYQEYNEHRQAGDSVLALQSAARAYSLSLGVYGNKSKITAAVGLNYGQLLLEMDKKSKAESILRQMISTHRHAFGDDSLELVDIYMAYGHAIGKPFGYKKQRKYYNRALDIAVAHRGADSRLVADLNLEAGSNLLSRSQSDKAGKYLKAALKTYLRLDGDLSAGVGQAHYWLGKLELAIDRLRYSVPHFEKAVAAFQTRDDSRAHLLSTYSFLVRVNQELGRFSAATPYCQAIGKLKPWNSDDQPNPLWVSPPYYSINSQVHNARGYADVAFTLTANGRAINVRIEASQGDPAFGPAARDAIALWRFAPRFVDGSAVDTESNYRVPFPFKI